MKQEILKATGVLTIVCLVSAFLLYGVNRLTAEKIEKERIKEEKASLHYVLPQATEFKKEKIGDEVVEIGYAEGRKIGEVYTVITRGYSGPIKIKVGINNEGKIAGIKILEEKETPGLGAKIKEKGFLSQFIGKIPSSLSLKPEGEIEGITGATISSKAVVEGIKSAPVTSKIKNSSVKNKMIKTRESLINKGKNFYNIGREGVSHR